MKKKSVKFAQLASFNKKSFIKSNYLEWFKVTTKFIKNFDVKYL